MIKYRFAVAMILAMTLGGGLAQAAGMGGGGGGSGVGATAGVPSPAITSQGPGLVSGSAGSSQSVMVPGSPVNGTLSNNGNGTGTMMVPGQASQTVPTAR